jgi:hypothetical protein
MGQKRHEVNRLQREAVPGNRQIFRQLSGRRFGAVGRVIEPVRPPPRHLFVEAVSGRLAFRTGANRFKSFLAGGVSRVGGGVHDRTGEHGFDAPKRFSL